MKITEKLKIKAAELKKLILTLYYSAKHPDLPRFTRFLIILTIAYALSPVDLIPDFIPVLGYLDDLIILPAMITVCVKRIPHKIWLEAKQQAEKQPVSLKKNWKSGAVIILIWLFVIYKLVEILFLR